MTMEFWKANDLFTTTQLVLTSGTITAQNMFDRNDNTQYISDGYGTTTASVIHISFTSSVVIDRIFIKNHNLKQFKIFYNSVTASVFDIPAIDVTQNSASTLMYMFSTITVSSLILQMDLATTDDTEKAVGELYIGELLLVFERNPEAKSYKPILNRTSVVHKMPNGGVSRFIVDEKMKITFTWEYLTQTFYDSLYSIFDSGNPMYFVPFGTTTAWNGQAWEVIWTGDFNFDFSNNNQNAGYGGNITIEETA